MKRTIGLITIAMAMDVSFELAAQGQQPATAQAPAVVRITVTGCVEPAAPSARDSSKTDTKYVLTDAKSEQSGQGPSTGTKAGQSGQASGTGSTSSSPSSSTYRLNANDKTLGPQVGHHVEIVAVVEEPGTPTPVGTSGSAESTAAAPKLKVEQIKMIAATCPK